MVHVAKPGRTTPRHHSHSGYWHFKTKALDIMHYERIIATVRHIRGSTNQTSRSDGQRGLSTMQIMKASQQWSERPADERFWTIQDLYEATRAHREAAIVAKPNLNQLRVEAKEGDIQLVGEHHNAQLTHWAFGQLAARAEAPASYLRKLPATLAAQNLNHG